MGNFTLSIDRIQSDPYAPPSLMRIILDRKTAGIPPELLDDAQGRLAMSDFLMREFHAATRESSISIGWPAQAILERTNIRITERTIEARITVQLPAGGRRIHGHAAARMLSRRTCRMRWIRHCCTETWTGMRQRRRLRCCGTRRRCGGSLPTWAWWHSWAMGRFCHGRRAIRTYRWNREQRRLPARNRSKFRSRFPVGAR